VAKDTMTLFIVLLYFAALVFIGWLSRRWDVSTPEAYFLANRSLGGFVLLMALFGANVTAFTLLGLTGLAYHAGIGVFGFFGAIAALVVPLNFVVFGYPIWKFGQEQGFMTPSQMFAARYDSERIGRLLFVLLFLYTIPYLVIGIMGGGIAVENLSQGTLSYHTGAALVALVTVVYTFLGGMRATAWTNCLQAVIFMAFLLLVCVATARALGGPTAIHGQLLEQRPELLGKAHPMLAPGYWATGLLVGVVSVIAFPHVFMRLLAAKSIGALRHSVYLYPFALLLLFLPVTLVGVWGAIAIPGLERQDSDAIVPMLAARYLPIWLSGLGLAAILAAIMSSLDAQLLSLATMFSADVHRRGSQSQPSTRAGRALIIVLAAVAFAAAVFRPEAIYNISIYAFSGYTLIVPVMAAGLFWSRSTAPAILISTIAAHGMLLLYHVPWGMRDALPNPGVFPVTLCLAVQVVLLVGVSLATQPVAADIQARFANPFGPVKRRT